MTDLEKLQKGIIRRVSARRKRKLWQNRRVICWWSLELGSYVWQPPAEAE